ncbi:hypothetical protein F2P81_010863 [Scophthalmus maximus]|uniref:Uncharacterized protein n=1 Tax=Scophthalmus maximus TaxID=52904 RepID=A0A6A4SZ38_SCOMX|nr:hypothetical protein F2P81_010863 [Scophthalmus maximus]
MSGFVAAGPGGPAERLLNAIVGDSSVVEDLSDGGADDPGAEQPGDEHHIPPDSSKMTVTVNTNSIRVHLNVIKSSDDEMSLILKTLQQHWNNDKTDTHHVIQSNSPCSFGVTDNCQTLLCTDDLFARTCGGISVRRRQLVDVKPTDTGSQNKSLLLVPTGLRLHKEGTSRTFNAARSGRRQIGRRRYHS